MSTSLLLAAVLVFFTVLVVFSLASAFVSAVFFRFFGSAVSSFAALALVAFAFVSLGFDFLTSVSLASVFLASTALVVFLAFGLAGFAAALAEGELLTKAIYWGNAAGALAATRQGAQPSLPTRGAVETLLSNNKEIVRT